MVRFNFKFLVVWLHEIIPFVIEDYKVEKVITKVTKEQQERLSEQTGIGPSFSMEDARQYITEVVDEVRKNVSHVKNHT